MTDYLDGQPVKQPYITFETEKGCWFILFYENGVEVMEAVKKPNPAQSWLDRLIHGTSYMYERARNK